MNQPHSNELRDRVFALVAERYPLMDANKRAALVERAIASGSFSITPIGTIARPKGAGPLIALGIADCAIQSPAEKKADDARLSAAIAEPAWDGYSSPNAPPPTRVQLGPDATLEERFKAYYGKTIAEAIEG